MTKKKLLFIFLAGFLLLLLIIPKPRKKSVSIPNQSFPLPSIQPFSISLPINSMAENLQYNKLKTAVVYQTTTPAADELISFFSKLRQDFNLANDPTTTSINSVSHFVWIGQSGYLDVNSHTGQFNFKPATVGKTTTIINRIQALDIAKNFLLKYRFLSSFDKYEIFYLKSSGYQLQSVAESANPDIFRFYFYPEINQLPTYSINYEPSPIMIDIDNSGDIFQINYQLPVLTMMQLSASQHTLKTTTHSIKSETQIASEIKNNQPIITSVQISSGTYAASTAVFKNINYQQIALGYQFDSGLNQLTPVFRLQGTGTIEDGTNMTVTAYLPALAE